MQLDEEGFFYPNINIKSCINCGKCLAVCPENAINLCFFKSFSDFCYAGIHKDKLTLLESSSGGAFSAICEVLGSDYSVYGACFDNDLTVIHTCSMLKETNFNRIRKSKYVQSRINSIFLDIRQKISEGKKVAFSGTPCQVSGLLHFLGDKSDLLFTIELICHGVGSPGVFASYIKKLEKNEKIIAVDFRDKLTKYSRWGEFYTTTTTTTGKKKSSSFDYFTQGFLSGLFLRKACYHCSYAKRTRCSDVVIGDFWGIEKYLPAQKTKDGVSLIIPVSEKGMDISKQLCDVMDLYKLPTDIAIKGNKVLLEHEGSSSQREEFFVFYRKRGVLFALKKYVKRPFILKRMLLLFLSEKHLILLRNLRMCMKRDGKKC